jgi:hypothetical protein
MLVEESTLLDVQCGYIHLFHFARSEDDAKFKVGEIDGQSSVSPLSLMPLHALTMCLFTYSY